MKISKLVGERMLGRDPTGPLLQFSLSRLTNRTWAGRWAQCDRPERAVTFFRWDRGDATREMEG